MFSWLISYELRSVCMWLKLSKTSGSWTTKIDPQAIKNESQALAYFELSSCQVEFFIT